MTAPQFIAAGNDTFQVTGALTFETVGDLWRSSQGQFAAGAKVRIDLGGVNEIDSAGLALLVEWVHWARAQADSVTFERIPAKLRALARIGDVDQLLSITPASAPQP